MSSRHHAAPGTTPKRGGGVREPAGDGQVGRLIEAEPGVPANRGGRAWINGTEVGGADSRYLHLSRSYD